MEWDGILLITGSTGALGIELVRALLRECRGQEGRFLIRASSDDDLRRRWQDVLAFASDGYAAPEDVPTFRPLRGDITRHDVGLEGSLLAEVRRNVTHIIHAAADTNFLAPLLRSRAVNVEGTTNVLAFAARCRSLRQIGHISSLFVAGKRSGTVFDTDLEHEAGFGNNYEQTKYEAEVFVRNAMCDLPITVYRLALLPGTANYVYQPGAFHTALHFYHSGLLPIIPGFPSSPIDLLPTDYAAKALLTLFFYHYNPGTTYQISNGPTAITLKNFFDLTVRTFSEMTPLWRAGVFQQPEIVDMDTYELFVSAARRARNATFLRAIRVMNTLVHHLVLPKVFDSTRVESLLNGRIPKPSIEVFYPQVLRYCVTEIWGRTSPERISAHDGSRVRAAAS